MCLLGLRTRGTGGTKGVGSGRGSPQQWALSDCPGMPLTGGKNRGGPCFRLLLRHPDRERVLGWTDPPWATCRALGGCTSSVSGAPFALGSEARQDQPAIQGPARTAWEHRVSQPELQGRENVMNQGLLNQDLRAFG